MDVKMIDKLKDKLCIELEQVSRKTAMSSGDLESIYKLIVSIEKLMKIEEMEGRNGFSQRSYGMMPNAMNGGSWTANGNYDRSGGSYDRSGGSYDRGDSYGDNSMSNAGMHFVRPHYSREDGAGMVRDRIESMMSRSQLGENDRRILEKAMDILG